MGCGSARKDSKPLILSCWLSFDIGCLCLYLGGGVRVPDAVCTVDGRSGAARTPSFAPPQLTAKQLRSVKGLVQVLPQLSQTSLLLLS